MPNPIAQRPLRGPSAALILLLAIPGVAAAQRALQVPPPAAITALRAATPPVIDGVDDDEIWRAALPVTAFRVVRPVEDGDPHLRTEARIAYDSHALYVLVRAFDPHPDSIVALMARRDLQTPSDGISVLVDSYHDRRTGYEFQVNPAGVKVDYAISQDSNEDPSWDGIWDVATRIDSLGWVAEFRIPLAQLRYAVNGSNSFGLGIWRTVERTAEQSSWPAYHVSRPGLASQLGEVIGLDDLAAPKRAELAPYFVTRNISVPTAHGFDRGQRAAAGADMKFAVASNLRITGTINPDFGQVEADPAVLNLSAFETFFPEKRPFFVEGNGLFQFNLNCSAVNCSNEELFYSRRIGRAPQLGGAFGEIGSPTATTILGAAKLTARLPGGLAIGAIDAVTQRESGSQRATIEPSTNYAVLRGVQEFSAGATGIGAMFTGVNRSLDRWTDTALASDAYAGAIEFRHQFFNRRYELSTSVDFSRVSGHASAIASLQRNDVHLYQRPDGPLHVDSTRTALGGNAEEVHFGKIGGRRLMFETSYLRRSPGFDVNDLGYLRQADQQSWNNWAGLSFNTPTRVYRSLRWNLNWWQYWTAAGLPTERAANTNVHTQFANHWWLHAGGTVGQQGTTWCDRCARGGPAIRQDRYFAPWAGIQGDDRNRVIPSLWINWFEGAGGRNTSLNLNPAMALNVSTRLSASFGANLQVGRTDDQWYANYGQPGAPAHYTFAHLNQHTLSLTADLGYTFTPTLTVQWHVQPFISRGTYTNLRELANPAATRYEDRYRPYQDSTVTNHLGGFDAKQLNSNLVVRWEYRAGSTIFFVWTQGRSDFANAAGSDGMHGDLRDLFRLHADNTLLVKVSYWINR